MSRVSNASPIVPRTTTQTKWYPKLIGTRELENQQYIGQTPHKYVHIDMKMNFMHISSNLRLGGVSPIYWVKERKHAKETT